MSCPSCASRVCVGQESGKGVSPARHGRQGSKLGGTGLVLLGSGSRLDCAWEGWAPLPSTDKGQPLTGASASLPVLSWGINSEKQLQAEGSVAFTVEKTRVGQTLPVTLVDCSSAAWPRTQRWQEVSGVSP